MPNLPVRDLSHRVLRVLRRHQHLLGIWCFGAGVLPVLRAGDPSRQQQGSDPQGQRRNSTRVMLPSNPATAAPPPSNVIIAHPGDSMFTLSGPGNADPREPKLEDISFFAVPTPQPKTLKKHDLLTIVIREESAFQSKGTKTLQKDVELKSKLDQFVQLKLSNLTLKGLAQAANPADIDIDGHRTFNGQGDYDRTDSLTARIEAEIVDVKPNGTLVVQARKKIKTDEEEQEFILTGICRVDDVTADNSVLSTQIFDLELQKNHKGDVKTANTRGLLPKLLDLINPF